YFGSVYVQIFFRDRCRYGNFQTRQHTTKHQTQYCGFVPYKLSEQNRGGLSEYIISGGRTKSLCSRKLHQQVCHAELSVSSLPQSLFISAQDRNPVCFRNRKPANRYPVQRRAVFCSIECSAYSGPQSKESYFVEMRD